VDQEHIVIIRRQQCLRENEEKRSRKIKGEGKEGYTTKKVGASSSSRVGKARR